jgi:hypothetical protein
MNQKSSKKDIETVNQLMRTTKTSYTATVDEKEMYNFVMKRYNDMKRARSLVDNKWQIYQLQWESRLKRYPDGRSASNMPIEFMAIEAYRSEADKKKPNPIISTK